MQRGVQDGSKGRPWTHLLPRTQQSYSYMWNTFLLKRTWELDEQYLYTKKREEMHWERWERQRYGLTQDPTETRMTPTTGRESKNTELPLEEWVGWASHQVPHHWELEPERQDPKPSDVENQWGLRPGESQKRRK